MANDPDREGLERVGTVLNDKWTLERLLGVGGMAAVYAGRHRNGARAAIKVLHADLARHKEVRERFRREGYAANKVEHPGVVKVLDDDIIASGPDEGTAYIVMELLEGESLQDRLERGQAVGEVEFLEIAEQVLAVLQAAHDAGVVHRDLKPENLFYARQESEGGKERIKVLDFGLARLLSAQAITTYGLALGTPSFMSPEQAAGRVDEVDGRTDLFGLAATGFRLRAGRRIQEADNPIELVRMMARSPAPRIRTVAPDVSEPFARVIDKALEFKREDRYENAAAMRDDVKRALSELDAGTGEIRLPPPRPRVKPPVAEGRDRTIEVSESDIEPSRRVVAQGIEEPIRTPKKRRSIIPWVTLLLFVGIGVKLWLDWSATADAPLSSDSPADAAPSAVAATGSGAHDASSPSRAGAEAGPGRIRQPLPGPRPTTTKR